MIADVIKVAIEQLKAAFPSAVVESVEDGSGGAFVTVTKVPVGAPYVQEFCWFGFHITAQYPYADIYPHFVQADLARLDGGSLGEAVSPGSFQGRAALQLSRRSNRHDHQRDTAVLKLMRIVSWLRSKK